MRSPDGVRPLVTAGVVVVAAAAVAVAAVIPVRGGPPGTTGLVALLAFAMALMTGIAVSGAPERARAETAAGTGADTEETVARQPARHEAVLPPPAPAEEVPPRRGRCFGCVRLAAVTETGVLARGGVEVPLYVCSSCLEHLEAWHAAQLPVARADRTGAGFAP
ncbi:hypothetical protein GCM10010495_17370 [Kitasatospora herbaricolor]|uniref:hypothetical protein n=1 Tax=Kitasatospora herbaricolor TaxID=68217 RepID=UPI00174D0410|nr:hypothetical protein [Kitasatospora herbaricolor]MDQ0308190.1 hypothetical protein [Kitasatospora herbaricolor]GGV05906.1 hypothetical protein GCM10010495_17370 [Kitasatospora herbaricolor]